MNQSSDWIKWISPYLKTEWIKALETLDVHKRETLQEIRLRSGRPIMITAGGKSYPVVDNPICSDKDLETVFLTACEFSPASRIHQIRQGYVMLRGGLRMGIGGRCVEKNGSIENIYPVSSLNIRILREIKGSASTIIPKIRRERGIYNTLILAPPGGGKTTILRDAIRILSGPEGIRIGVVDERGELAGCIMGVPSLDIGLQSDVLDGCSKSWGMRCLLRSMTPQVIAVDELGAPEDVEAIREAARCGVQIMATAHGSGMEDVHRPMLKQLMEQKIFARVVILTDTPGETPVVKVI